ncbi:DUF4386 domain-containing protein [Lysinibacter cavernae]|uniref:DUF4386 domain-containing protein n=1 Tax=Lysinibacter cavernae TaxID=1640652 RepID=A0A7X5R060_9MICO|nr:DUF4386 domain-containing protein [Lysinibacter cavernae]NIH53249.1 hypothetical protein [Lysinibacter cavernae]
MNATASPAQNIRRSNLIAGLALLLMAVLAAFGNLIAIDPLIVPDEAAATAENFLASNGLLWAGIGALTVVAALDVIVAITLLPLLSLVNRRLAVIATVLRILYAALFLVAIAQLVVAALNTQTPQATLAVTELFTMIWQAALVLFGVHLLLVGYLAVRSPMLWTILGVLLVVAGLGYVIDGVGNVAIAGYSGNIAQFAFVGEVVLIVWLLARGTRLSIPTQEGTRA